MRWISYKREVGGSRGCGDTSWHEITWRSSTNGCGEGGGGGGERNRRTGDPTGDEEHPASRLEDPESGTHKVAALHWPEWQIEWDGDNWKRGKSPRTHEVTGTTSSEEPGLVDWVGRPECSSFQECNGPPTTPNATWSTGWWRTPSDTTSKTPCRPDALSLIRTTLCLANWAETQPEQVPLLSFRAHWEAPGTLSLTRLLRPSDRADVPPSPTGTCRYTMTGTGAELEMEHLTSIFSSWGHHCTASTQACNKRIGLAGLPTIGDLLSFNCQWKGRIRARPLEKNCFRDAMCPSSCCHIRAGELEGAGTTRPPPGSKPDGLVKETLNRGTCLLSWWDTEDE